MKPWQTYLASAILAAAASTAAAAEPNETFATATVLPPGTLTVADEFTTPGEPDTLLGIEDQFGSIYFVDDDGSPVGNGLASGVGGAPTNSGSIDFSVTGVGDDFFEGNHGESGGYEVFVDVYDFGDELIDSFSEVRTLQPGIVDDFSFNDFEWIGGSYDVYIENVISLDVDFFTFTGLTPGGAFTAETFAPAETDRDTLLGWFDSSGALLQTNDDIDDTTLLSRIEGTVPADGKLTFAVSGFGDDDFVGAHSEFGEYELRITAPTAPVLAADFDDNGSVNAADLAIWRGAFGVPGNTSGNADGDTDTDGADFLVWQRERGSGPLQPAAAVPEPHGLALAALALMCCRFARQRS
jgi:hypothetical protein